MRHLLAILLLALPFTACGGKAAAPAAPAPQWDAQWDSYRNTLKEDEEKARKSGRPAPAQPRPCNGSPSPVNPKIEQPLSEAKQAMYAGKYQEALDRTDAAIDIDPISAAAWEVRGSAFYTLGKAGEAKLAWTRAYELDPCLKEIPAFLEKLRSESGPTR